MESKTLENYNRWLNSKNVSKENKELLKEMDDKTKDEAFFKDIEFGTGGLRGILGPGTNRMNYFTVKKTTIALGLYVLKFHQHGKEKGIAISHDNRHFSREFALESSKILNEMGIKTYIFDSLRPTPELSYAVRYYKCDGGIMITASHNPKEYNGYKLYDKNGCQLIPELAQKVIDEIEKLDDVLSIKPDYTEDKHHFLHEVDKEVDRAYYDDVLGIRINPEVKKDF